MLSTPRFFHVHTGTWKRIVIFFTAALLLFASAAQAQLTIPGNNGQDGVFAPNASIQVDLSQAVTGPWDTTASSGQGVYDPEQWAVIFRYTSVTIPSGATVTFKNHPSRAPVIWLVQENVTVTGTVSLNGGTGHGDEPAAATLAEPGPGGFRGGRALRGANSGSAGMGPGGGGYPRSGGSYRTPGIASSGAVVGAVYGNDGLFPLMGGSGGSGSNDNWKHGGGGGGGAILIAAAETIQVSGTIRANGGSTSYFAGGGSGGGIRLIADAVGGTGGLSVDGGGAQNVGGAGRIRVEANTITLTVALIHSVGVPGNPPRIFREPGDGVPSITAMTLNGQPVPEDPASFPNQDVGLVDVESGDTVILAITAEHVPEGSAVNARVVRLSGAEQSIPATFNGSAGDETYWNAQIPVSGGFSTIQVHAVLP